MRLMVKTAIGRFAFERATRRPSHHKALGETSHWRPVSLPRVLRLPCGRAMAFAICERCMASHAERRVLPGAETNTGKLRVLSLQ
jgi:hypothetical protein